MSLETIQRVLDACPTTEWKAIIALCRFGGLRCPSEVLKLRWTDIDWDQNRVLVRSPKTEHHEGGESRTIPLFPELREILSELHLSPEGAEFVIKPKAQGGKSNLRTTMEKIITKAGVEPWGKPFQNLRSSRETELMQTHPIHVVTAWLGNTPKVAMESYLQVRDSDFEKAISTRILAQNLAQQASAVTGDDSQDGPLEAENTLIPAGTQGAANARDQIELPGQDSNLN